MDEEGTAANLRDSGVPRWTGARGAIVGLACMIAIGPLAHLAIGLTTS